MARTRETLPEHKRGGGDSMCLVLCIRDSLDVSIIMSSCRGVCQLVSACLIVSPSVPVCLPACRHTVCIRLPATSSVCLRAPISLGCVPMPADSLSSACSLLRSIAIIAQPPIMTQAHPGQTEVVALAGFFCAIPTHPGQNNAVSLCRLLTTILTHPGQTNAVPHAGL